MSSSCMASVYIWGVYLQGTNNDLQASCSYSCVSIITLVIIIFFYYSTYVFFMNPAHEFLFWDNSCIVLYCTITTTT